MTTLKNALLALALVAFVSPVLAGDEAAPVSADATEVVAEGGSDVVVDEAAPAAK